MLKPDINKVYRKKGTEWLALIFGAFALVIVLGLLCEMKRMLPDLSADHPSLPGDRMTGIMDSVYYHYPFHFALPLPAPGWQFVQVSDDTVVHPCDEGTALLPQVKWLADLERPDLADARLGVLALGDSLTAKDLAISILDGMIDGAEDSNGRVSLLQPLSGPAHRILQGWYFALILPEPGSPVWVVTVLPRGELIFILWCRTDEENYVRVREDCQALTSRFKPLLMSARPQKKKPYPGNR